MRKEGSQTTPEKVVQDIRRKTRRRFSAEDEIRIVLEGLRGEESIATLCRKEGLAPNLYYRWSKEFLEAGKKRLVVVWAVGFPILAMAMALYLTRLIPLAGSGRRQRESRRSGSRLRELDDSSSSTNLKEKAAPGKAV
jgi:Transposase